MASFSFKQVILFLGLPIAVFASGAQQARSQIETSGRFLTSINDGSGTQSCVSGVCAISGGTDADSNKFHRFTKFNANLPSETSITGVTIETIRRVILFSVLPRHPMVLIECPTESYSSANLFIVSPDGISLSTVHLSPM